MIIDDILIQSLKEENKLLRADLEFAERTVFEMYNCKCEYDKLLCFRDRVRLRKTIREKEFAEGGESKEMKIVRARG